MLIVRFFLFSLSPQSIQGGDKLTLSLGSNPSPTSNKSALAANGQLSPSERAKTPTSSSSSPSSTSGAEEKRLINLDSPVSTSPPKEENADPNKGKQSISVTHFSEALIGNGLEKETIFTGSSSTAANNSKNPFTNPFLEDANAAEGEAVETGNSSNPFKYNTIGRSNPFSKNPFLDSAAVKAAEVEKKSNKENSSPDGSLNDPTPILTPNHSTSVTDSSPSSRGEETKTLNKIVSYNALCMSQASLVRAYLNWGNLTPHGHVFSWVRKGARNGRNCRMSDWLLRSVSFNGLSENDLVASCQMSTLILQRNVILNRDRRALKQCLLKCFFLSKPSLSIDHNDQFRRHSVSVCVVSFIRFSIFYVLSCLCHVVIM